MHKKIVLSMLAVLLGFALIACKKDPKVKFEFEGESVTMAVGDAHELKYELVGDEVEFSLSKDGIVTILGDTITAIAQGEVTITGKVKGADVSDTLRVIVEGPAVESITITGPVSGYIDETINLTANVLPEDLTGITVVWESSNEDVATVDNGEVTLKAGGDVVITAKVGTVSATHNIKVYALNLDSLGNAFKVIGQKNYQMDISILIYNEFQALLTLQFDNNVSYLKEGEFIEEWYVREGRELTTIIKDGDNYLVSEERDPVDRGFLLFDNLDKEWFMHLKDSEFRIKNDHIEDARALFEISETISIDSISVILGEDLRVERFTVVFSENRDPYYMYIDFSNYGNVSIDVPEVK